MLQFHGWTEAAKTGGRIVIVTANGVAIMADKTLALLRGAMSHGWPGMTLENCAELGTATPTQPQSVRRNSDAI